MEIEITAPSNAVKPGSVVHLSAKATAGGARLPGVSVAWSIPLLKVKDAVSTTDANGDAPFVVQAFSEGIASVTARQRCPATRMQRLRCSSPSPHPATARAARRRC